MIRPPSRIAKKRRNIGSETPLEDTIGPSRVAKKRRTIGCETSLEDTIGALADRGCSNLTLSIDLASCGEYPLGAGGFCDVYRGVLQDGTQIAIKSLRVFDRPGQDDNRKKILKRAARELYYWSKLTHRNVLPLLGLAMFRGQISMVSEWMENGSLMSFVRLNGGVNRLKLCIDTCAGLDYIHKIGMVHGDLKAANVMVSAAGVAVIADFGNSELRELTLKFTKTSSSTLTIRWAAPEILLQDSGPYASKEADVYAYAMTALETLTGNIPYKDLNDQQVLRQVAYRNLRPTRPEGGIGDELWDMLTSCWARIPSERPMIAVIKEQLRTLSQKEEPSASHFGPEETSGEHGGLEILDRPGSPKLAESSKLDPSDLAVDSTHHKEPGEHGTNSSEAGSLDTISDVFSWDEDYEHPSQAPVAAQADDSTSGEQNYNYSPEDLFQSIQTRSLSESPDHRPSNLPGGASSRRTTSRSAQPEPPTVRRSPSPQAPPPPAPIIPPSHSEHSESFPGLPGPPLDIHVSEVPGESAERSVGGLFGLGNDFDDLFGGQLGALDGTSSYGNIASPPSNFVSPSSISNPSPLIIDGLPSVGESARVERSIKAPSASDWRQDPKTRDEFVEMIRKDANQATFGPPLDSEDTAKVEQEWQQMAQRAEFQEPDIEGLAHELFDKAQDSELKARMKQSMLRIARDMASGTAPA